MERRAQELIESLALEPPPIRGSMTIFDVAVAESHIDAVREWSRGVWESWAPHHARIAELVSKHL